MRFIDMPLYARQMLVVSFIFTLVLSVVGLFTAVRLCKKRRFIILSAVTVAGAFAAVFLTMRGSYRYRVGLSVFEPSLTVIGDGRRMTGRGSALGSVGSTVSPIKRLEKVMSPGYHVSLPSEFIVP